MNKGQQAAINRFCRERGFTRDKLLDALKECGAIDVGATLEDLSRCVNGETFCDMWKFLEVKL